MGKVNFIFGVHNHQPVGNFGEVFEKAYNRAYLPLIEVLERHPKIKWNLHSSGILWDWLKENKSEYIHKVKTMAGEGRLELITGGYYEPVLCAVPDKDKKGQIRKLSKFIERSFNCKPRGLWLTERVWEPQLPKPLSEAGVEYTIVDDAHFNSNGMPQDKISGYFHTEEQGCSLKIFPIDKMLRYMIPFSAGEDCIAYFKKFADKNNEGLLVMADDGEKFGLWPGTYEHVYTNGWLDRFFTLIENNSDWIETWKFGDYAAMHQSKGIVYLPSASYFEMSEWTLPAELQIGFEEAAKHCKSLYPEEHCGAFLRSANWRNFLYKYSESNNMHKKMLYVSSKVNSIKEEMADKKTVEEAFDALWAGQCNCAYWHGVFGGLYLPHLREAVYKNLIKAECRADEANAVFNGRDFRHILKDYNSDGSDEILIESVVMNYYFAPHKGGSLVECDYKPAYFNASNVLTRRFEPYHLKIKSASPASANICDDASAKSIHSIVKVKQSGLEDVMVYDWHEKLSFLDHFLHNSVSLDALANCSYGEQGNFILSEYGWKIHEEKGRNPVLKLFRDGNVWFEDEHRPVSVIKEFEFLKNGGIALDYSITNKSAKKIDLWFGFEMNFLLDRLCSAKESLNGRTFRWPLAGGAFEFLAEFPSPVDLWKFPIETVSQSEEGFEKTYQGATILPNFKFSLGISESYSIRCKLSFINSHND